MPKLTITDFADTEREVELPTTCPDCGADFHERFSLKVYSAAVVMVQARLNGEGEIADLVGQEEPDLGSTIEVRCAECDFGLTD